VVDHCRFINQNGFGIFVTASGTNTSARIWITNNYLYGRGNNDVIGGGPVNSTGASVREAFVENNIVIQDATLGVNHKNAINFVGVLPNSIRS
jgi:hypothetical protein